MQSWTFTHLYYPNPEDNEGGIEGFFVKLMSLPTNMASLRKQFYFTMFYTLTTVFAFMNSTIYWFITRAHNLEDDSGDAPDDGDAPDAVLKLGGNIGAPCKLGTFHAWTMLMTIEQSAIFSARGGSSHSSSSISTPSRLPLW